LKAGIEAKELNNKKLLEAVDVARVIQPWKSTKTPECLSRSVETTGQTRFWKPSRKRIKGNRGSIEPVAHSG